MNVTGLNHAVLWVRDARASAAFYQRGAGLHGRRGRPRRAGGVPAGRGVDQPPRPRAVHGRRPPGAAAALAGALPPGVAGRHDRGPGGDGQGAARARRPGRRHRPRRVQEPVRQGSRRHRVRGDVAGAARARGRATTPASSRSTSTPSSRAGPACRPAPDGQIRQLSASSDRSGASAESWRSAVERGAQRRLERRVPPLEAVALQDRAGSTRWLSKSRASARSPPSTSFGPERRHRQHRRAVQHVADRVGELGVAHRLGRGEVHRPDDVARQQVDDRARPRRRGRSSSSTGGRCRSGRRARS